MTVLKRRHLFKAITWRVVASATTFVIGWVVTGNVEFGFAIGIADVIIKIGLYYFHERIWYHSKYGVITNKMVSGESELSDNGLRHKR